MTAEDDRSAVSRIYERSWKYAYRDIIPQAYLDALTEGQWIRKLDNPEWSSMVCIENGEYIGTGSFSRSRDEQYPEAGEVISIYLLPEYTGKGYGRKLLAAMMEEMKQRCFREVFLWVLEENSRAGTFYEQYGFLRTEDYMNIVIGGKELREIRYVFRF